MEKTIINNKEFKPLTSLEEFKKQCETFEKMFEEYEFDPVVEDLYDLACNEDNDAILAICEAFIEQYVYYSKDGEIIAKDMPECAKQQINKFRKEMIENEIEA